MPYAFNADLVFTGLVGEKHQIPAFKLGFFNRPSDTQKPEDQPPAAPEIPVPQIKTVSYLNVTSDGVNIRSGAGTNYAARGNCGESRGEFF